MRPARPLHTKHLEADMPWASPSPSHRAGPSAIWPGRILRPAASPLAPRPRRNGSTGLFLLAGLLALAGILGTIGFFAMRGGGDTVPITLVHTARRAPFLHEVVERGEVESSSNVEIRCEVESRNSAGTAILEVVPEGTEVEAGDILVRLDSSALEQERLQQRILVASAEAAMVQARNAYEAAQIALKEYLEGTFRQEEQTIQGEIFTAEENLRRAVEYAAYSEQLAAKGYVTQSQLEGDQFAVDQARIQLETAQTRLKVLQEYTKPKMAKDLESQIATALAQWKAAESTFQLEFDKLAKIEEQINKCTIRAPQAGQVVYANEESRRGESEFIVEPGAMVRERQVIIRLPDPRYMQVKAEINEARITLVKPGMNVKIRLDAFPELQLRGRVVRVNKYPESSGWFSSQVKEYATFIEIISPPDSLRPGLTAEVRIEVERLNDRLQVPIQALHEHGDKLFCMVQRGDGWEAREIQRGSANDKFVVVTDGLDEGERVAMNPAAVLNLVSLPKLPPAKEDEDQWEEGGGDPAGAPDDSAVAAADAAANSLGGGLSDQRPIELRPSQIVQRIFERLDTDKDLRISTDELLGVFGEQLRGADQNNDGQIDRTEILAVVVAGQMDPDLWSMAEDTPGGASAP